MRTSPAHLGTSCFLNHCLLLWVSVHTVLNQQMSTTYWSHLKRLWIWGRPFGFLRFSIRSFENLQSFAPHNCLGVCWPICSASCVKSLQSWYHMWGWWCQRRSYHSQGHIPSADRNQVGNQKMDGTLPSTATLFFPSPPHFSHLLYHKIAFVFFHSVFNLWGVWRKSVGFVSSFPARATMSSRRDELW